MRSAIKYLTDMKRLPIVLLLVIAGFFLAFKTINAGGTKTPPGKYEEILRMVGEMLKQGHFSPKNIDDSLSLKIFDGYIKMLDSDKTFFLQRDLDSLKNLYGTKLDDEINGAPVVFFKEAGKVFKARVNESAANAASYLKKPFNYKIDEEVELDSKNFDFTKTVAERNERWRKKVKLMSLEQYADLLTVRERNKGVDSFVVKADSTLEREARQKANKTLDRIFERYNHKFSDDDMFSLYVNSITALMDTHTEFMPPEDKRYFDEEMSGTFYGIGALLQYDEGSIKIASVVAGGPAAKSGQIEAGDYIAKVTEAGSAETVELIGYLVSDAVKVIRGKEGSSVTLTLKKTDGRLKDVTLKREKIDNDIETFARSVVVNEGGLKIGYIYLPSFYADFDNANGRRSYLDVAREVEKLKKQNIDGIVMDLRNNGGGSLYDVVQMAGLFIGEGPVVQVKDRVNKPNVLSDKDKTVLYNGPLAVMVNEFSASASEIFAAAIQDYGRGVVIGSTSTYGKGTVQRNIGIDKNGFSNTNAELGTIKLTLQKFYRINGGSTQLNGVSSDIVLPDQYEFLKVREKDAENALEWDEIAKSPYRTWDAGYNLDDVKNLSKLRLENDTVFSKIHDYSKWLYENNNKTVSLKLDDYKKSQKEITDVVAKTRNLLKLKEELNVASLDSEKDKYAGDKAKADRYNQWLTALRQDIYLNQAIKVINDVVNLQNIAKGKGTAKPEDAPKKAF